MRVDPVQADPWPYRSYLPLGAYESAVPCARAHIRLVLWEWGLEHLADAVELIVSELCTNAVRASAELPGYRRDGQWIPGRPPVRLWLWADGQRALVQVWDGDSQLPVRQQPGPEAEHGRGLWLVESFSIQCGVYRLEGWSGKLVWAALGLNS